MNGMTTKDIAEWAAERGYRLGWADGFEAGKKAADLVHYHERLKESGVRGARDDSHKILTPEQREAE